MFSFASKWKKRLHICRLDIFKKNGMSYLRLFQFLYLNLVENPKKWFGRKRNGFGALAEVYLISISSAPLDSDRNKVDSGWGKQVSSIEVLKFHRKIDNCPRKLAVLRYRKFTAWNNWWRRKAECDSAARKLRRLSQKQGGKEWKNEMKTQTRSIIEIGVGVDT